MFAELNCNLKKVSYETEKMFPWLLVFMLTYANVLLTGSFCLKDTHEDGNYLQIQMSKKKSNYHICEKAEFNVALRDRDSGGVTRLSRGLLEG